MTQKGMVAAYIEYRIESNVPKLHIIAVASWRNGLEVGIRVAADCYDHILISRKRWYWCLLPHDHVNVFVASQAAEAAKNVNGLKVDICAGESNVKAWRLPSSILAGAAWTSVSNRMFKLRRSAKSSAKVEKAMILMEGIQLVSLCKQNSKRRV